MVLFESDILQELAYPGIFAKKTKITLCKILKLKKFLHETGMGDTNALGSSFCWCKYLGRDVGGPPDERDLRPLIRHGDGQGVPALLIHRTNSLTFLY
jgi:hypothetical protein